MNIALEQTEEYVNGQVFTLHTNTTTACVNTMRMVIMCGAMLDKNNLCSARMQS